MFDRAEEAERFLTHLNTIYTAVHSLLLIRNRMTSYYYYSLDLLLVKDGYYDDENISTTVYRKPTHSGVFTHLLSFLFSIRGA